MGRLGAYKNPVYPYSFADPFVWKFEGEYFAVGTGPVAEKETASEHDFTSFKMGDRHVAFPLLRSPDLIHWKLVGGALDVSPEFQGATFWAPEVAYDGRYFYMYYSAAKVGIEHRLRVAKSASPTGPFIDQGPVISEDIFAIDAHPFQDVDGQWYLFYARDFLDFDDNTRAGTAIVVDKLVEMTRAIGGPTTVLRAKFDWQRFQSGRSMYGQVFDWHTLEGPFVRCHEGKYYCFYSGGCYQGDRYGVDYGVASNVLGPYDVTGSENGPRVLKTVPRKVIGPGHHSIVKGPDDHADVLVYHAWDPAMTARRMCISPLAWESGGPRCVM